ncbi:SDR family NAD(P)-dependent oxidoreductase [Pseudoxanthomonas sp. Root630]|uniref:SDR family NAD(P)-dependent oxidoreductase n=1 Tax=Pseudoxanthomonas sp. Root630 TaxID=1736574 RepID=UPI0007032FD6|nr:SDR family NAD(P)-dependent oxidoreductase [Pseudoxanthomonas sp. Root630]KRA46493.1 short-chain dehydrogenase [Pseudoxanthomonas sp. Root630]
MHDFSGKVVLITGAGSGIGEATAKRLAASGAQVVVSDINGEAAEKVAATIREAGGQAAANVANTARHEDVKAAVEFSVKHFGGLHLAFNNAGIGGSTAPLAELEIADWQRVIDINLSGVFYGMKYEIPAILASGGGAIVNTASILGLVGTAGLSAYVAAKHGVSGLTKTAAIEYSAKGVRINSVHPGYIDTPLLDFLDRDTHDGLKALHPIGRLGTAEEVADVVAFLLSSDAAFVTGSQYVVDGAYTSA